MKKIVALLLALAMLAAMAACTPADNTTSTNKPGTTGSKPTTNSSTPTSSKPEDNKGDGVMSFEEYYAAEVDTKVTIEAYVQATQNWYNGKITVYTQDAEGAYFLYDMPCSEEDAKKLVPGTKIRVTGYKANFEGQIEIADIESFEILDGSYIAEPVEFNGIFGDYETMMKQMAMLASFKNMTVEAVSFKNDEPGDDIYVDVSYDGIYFFQFCVERYLTGPETDVYKAVSALKVGDIVDFEGFAYWYNDLNPHITKVTVISSDTKGEGVMTYEEYVAAAIDDKVTIEAYVQATQNWYQDKITVYTQDRDGAYFLYGMPCSEEDAKKLVPGTKIRVTGYKADFEGEIEIADIESFEILEGKYIAPATDVTDLLSNEAELIKKQNMFVSFTRLTLEKVEYKNGEPGDDIYVTVSQDGVEYEFCVERYLTGPETDVYKAFEELVAGDTVYIEGFLYWYKGVNTHITAIYKMGR